MEQTPPDPDYTDGYESGRVGKPHTENPHKADSPEAEQWLKGWGNGSTKRSVANAKPDPDSPANG
jgi:ribosome modulation factor